MFFGVAEGVDNRFRRALQHLHTRPLKLPAIRIPTANLAVGALSRCGVGGELVRTDQAPRAAFKHLTARGQMLRTRNAFVGRAADRSQSRQEKQSTAGILRGRANHQPDIRAWCFSSCVGFRVGDRIQFFTGKIFASKAIAAILRDRTQCSATLSRMADVRNSEWPWLKLAVPNSMYSIAR